MFNMERVYAKGSLLLLRGIVMDNRVEIINAINEISEMENALNTLIQTGIIEPESDAEKEKQ